MKLARIDVQDTVSSFLITCTIACLEQNYFKQLYFVTRTVHFMQLFLFLYWAGDVFSMHQMHMASGNSFPQERLVSLSAIEVAQGHLFKRLFTSRKLVLIGLTGRVPCGYVKSLG